VHYQICRQGFIRTINNATCNITPQGCSSPVVTVNFKNIEPIPLTEEWLLKFGFELYESGYYFPYKINNQWEKDNWYFCANYRYNQIDICHRGNLGSLIRFDIKYVHQLQNLYFALTGTELEVKTA